MDEIRDAILADQLDAIGGLKTPESYRAGGVGKDEQDMFEGLATREKDPRKSLHVEEVPTPELGPGEALVAVMASSVNYNTVWTSIFEPVSTFGFLARYGRLHDLAKRHDLPYHGIGSDLAGLGVAVGPGVNKWKAGDEGGAGRGLNAPAPRPDPRRLSHKVQPASRAEHAAPQRSRPGGSLRRGTPSP